MHNNKEEVHQFGGTKISRAMRMEQATKNKPIEQSYRCIKSGHRQAECKFKTVKCFLCEKEVVTLPTNVELR